MCFIDTHFTDLLSLQRPETEDNKRQKDTWSIIQVYSPTGQSDTTSMDSFYLELNKTIQDHAHKNLVVMGDFNGQIGERQPVEDIVLGPFIYGKKARSKNGERLVNFAQENALKILNTMFKRKESKMWTWISPDGKTKNEIDFIMTNKSKYFSNMKVISNFNFNTNHRIIRAELTTTPLKNPRPRNIVMNTKPTKHQTDQIANSITTNLIDYNKETTNMEVQEKYNWLEGTIKAAIKQGNNSKDQSNQWMTTKTINLLNQRADLINGKNTNESRKQIAKLSKHIKESIRKDRIQKRMGTIERHIVQTGGIKKAYKELTNKRTGSYR
ncbi:Craniofacial development protein 2 [Eumeta japonica]|uniref:Craniofacial development protein 2 n=1 Tax=Eumeta variegata TaxID=151549 RepID=A0A4C1SY52_EUMVA|nr:Craniofacial development protein 2 [Eumeta japonica]